jgi:hypothetical protein
MLGTSVMAVLLLAVPAGAFDRPDFSGNWKMNPARSDYGPIPAPERMERKIVHEDPSLKFETVQVGQRGEVTTSMSYTTDGKPSTNKTPRGEITGTAGWDGEVLTINSKREFQGGELTQAERWALSADGKTLTIDNRITAAQGEFELRIVLDKQ